MKTSREQALTDVAHSLGLTFEGEDWAFGSLLSQMDAPIFARVGPGGRICNIMTGKREGLLTRFFDYSIPSGNWRVPIDIKQTLAAFSQDVWLPLFEIAPENVLNKFLDAMVHKNIRFQSNPDFSTRFRLRSPEEERIRKFFTPGMLSFLEGFDPNVKWHLEGCGLTLYIYRMEDLVKPEDFPQFVDETTAMAETFFSLSGLRKPTT